MSKIFKARHVSMVVSSESSPLLPEQAKLVAQCYDRWAECKVVFECAIVIAVSSILAGYFWGFSNRDAFLAVNATFLGILSSKTAKWHASLRTIRREIDPDIELL